MNGTQGIVWDFSFVVILSVAAILALVAIAAIVVDVKGGFDGMGIVGGGLMLLAILIIVPILTWPWEPQYHQWRPVSGQVEQISSRLIADGKSMSQRYVVVIAGQPYGVDDTRASLLKVGDSVSLMCAKEWVWASTPGDRCNWVA